jgi:hypothetical protein
MELKINGEIKQVKHIKHLDENCPICYITCGDGTVYQSGHMICAAIIHGKEVIRTVENGKITNMVKS